MEMVAPIRVVPGRNIEAPHEQVMALRLLAFGNQGRRDDVDPSSRSHARISVFAFRHAAPGGQIKLEQTWFAHAVRLRDAQCSVGIGEHERLRIGASGRAAADELWQNVGGGAALDLGGPAGKCRCADGRNLAIELLALLAERRMELQCAESARPAPGEQLDGVRSTELVFREVLRRHLSSPRIGETIGDQAGKAVDPLRSVKCRR